MISICARSTRMYIVRHKLQTIRCHRLALNVLPSNPVEKVNSETKWKMKRHVWLFGKVLSRSEMRQRFRLERVCVRIVHVAAHHVPWSTSPFWRAIQALHHHHKSVVRLRAAARHLLSTYDSRLLRLFCTVQRIFEHQWLRSSPEFQSRGRATCEGENKQTNNQNKCFDLEYVRK